MEKAEEKVELVWDVRPFDRQTAKGISAMAVIGAGIFGAFGWGGPVLGLVAALVLIGGTGSFFVRTRYRLTPEEVSVRSPFQKVTRPWKDFRQAHVGDQGVSLSPFAGRHLLEPYRSVMLRYGENRDEILDWVRRFGPGAGAEASHSPRSGKG